MKLENVVARKFWKVEIVSSNNAWVVKRRWGRVENIDNILCNSFADSHFNYLEYAEDKLKILVCNKVERQGFKIDYCGREERRLFNNAFLIRYALHSTISLNYEPSSEEIEAERVEMYHTESYSFAILSVVDQTRQARERLIERHNVLNRSGNVSISPQPILSGEDKKRNLKIMQQQSYYRKITKRPSLQKLLT